MNNLKPCPFCGSYYVRVCTIPTGYKLNPRVWYVKCDKCGTRSGMLFTKVETIAVWNARAELTCRIDSTLLIEGEYVPSPYYEYEIECGGGFCWDDSEPPTYCPNCGAKVIEEKGKGNDGE